MKQRGVAVDEDLHKHLQQIVSKKKKLRVFVKLNHLALLSIVLGPCFFSQRCSCHEVGSAYDPLVVVFKI